MKPLIKFAIYAISASLILASCTQNNTTTNQVVMTQVEQTVNAMQTVIAQLPTATQPQAATPTELSLPTFTPVPTLWPTDTPIPPTPTSTASFAVASVTDVTIPAGTTLQGGQSFVKTWKLVNGGTYAWGKDFKIIFTSGDNMGITSITLGRLVYPGDSVQISATFKAPVAAGAHVANFMMSTDTGETFGLGSNFDRPWAIKITVANVFAVTSASVSSSTSSYSGPCPATINLTPSITANGSGTVIYYLKVSGSVSDTYSMNFSASGTQSGTKVSWPIDSSMSSLQISIYISDPNHQEFGSRTISISCTAPTDTPTTAP